MTGKKKFVILKKHLILCEGLDAKLFLIQLLNSSELSAEPAFAEDIQVEDFGGNEDLPRFLEVLKNMSGFDEVETLMIIRDAEHDANLAVTQVQHALEQNMFSVPTNPCVWASGRPRTGFAIFPSCSRELKDGALEDLCLDVLKEPDCTAIADAIEGFLQGLTKNHQRQFPHRFKTKLHTYFSITDKFVSLKIGEAAKAGAFDWNHPRLAALKNFILEGVTGKSTFNS